MPAILFGSISSVLDTSELQRASFNEAFAQHDLGWTWDVDEYRDLLTSNGGAQRIADYAAARNQQVDADAVHETKSRLFRQKLAAATSSARPGVADTVAAAHEAGWQVGLVTTTSGGNVDALLAAVADEVPRTSFDVVVDITDVVNAKPDPEAYEFALQALGAPAGECVAIEDNVGGVESATSAGIACVAFPNANTEGHDFGDAERVTALDFAELAELTSAR